MCATLLSMDRGSKVTRQDLRGTLALEIYIIKMELDSIVLDSIFIQIEVNKWERILETNLVWRVNSNGSIFGSDNLLAHDDLETFCRNAAAANYMKHHQKLIIFASSQ